MSTLASRVATKHLAGKPAGAVTLPVLAKCSWRGPSVPETHEVYMLLEDPYKGGRGPVIIIADTGGRWYVKDFMPGHGPLAIDYGAGYWLDNADEVREAVAKFLATQAGPAAPKLDTAELIKRTRAFAAAYERGSVPLPMLRRMFRGVLSEASPFVLEMFGDRDSSAFEAALTKLRSFEGSSKEASNDGVLEAILPQRDMLKLIEKLQDEGDNQSATLVVDVYQKLQEKLQLSDNEEYALKRLLGCVENAGSWDVALLRNNIFKAADLLRMKLPSGMFASDQSKGKKAGTRDDLETSKHYVDRARSTLRAAIDDLEDTGSDKVRSDMNELEGKLEDVAREFDPIIKATRSME